MSSTPSTPFTTEYWRRCSSCKNPINYTTKYYACSVSTCNRKRVGYVFCSVHCWERHLPGARHRDAAAIEEHSPTMEAWKKELDSDGPSTSPSPSPTPQRVMATANPSQGSQSFARGSSKDPLEQEILVVVSKLKAYIKARGDMNTSDSVMEKISNKIRRIADAAMDKARADGRKTVMDRDLE